jgi:acyl-CoA thioesterase
MVPSAVVRAAGRAGAGTSLDNSMRFGPAPATDCEWVLIDFDPYFAHGGYAHGGARVWSSDGTLLAVASQTATLLLLD